MAGAILENLSTKKLSVFVAALVVLQIACFLLGGLIGKFSVHWHFGKLTQKFIIHCFVWCVAIALCIEIGKPHWLIITTGHMNINLNNYSEWFWFQKHFIWKGILYYPGLKLHGIKLLVFNKRMAMKLEASFSLTNINDSVKVIQLPLSKSIICGSQAPRSVWIIVIKYLQRGKISQFSCWKNVRACSSYDLTRGSYSLSPVLPGDVPIQVDGGHDRIQGVTAKPTN